MSRRIMPSTLEEYCVSALTKAGLTRASAQTVSDVLVMTDSWGTYSHGTAALFNYIKAMRAGGIDPHTEPAIAEQGPSWAIVDGHSAMGMLSSTLAMNLAIEKSRVNTIAWVGVRDSSHFGAAGYYANLAATEGMIGIAMSNADPNMVVPGARGHVIGNNPLAYAIPAGEEHTILLDIALSAVAAGKIFAMKALGESVPNTWITDAEGLSTSEVGDWPSSGSMQPMAGHKGYGIALLVEILAGALTGAGILSEVKSWMLDNTRKSRLGHAFIAIDIGQIIPIDIFKSRVDHTIRQLRDSPKAKGSERIYLPGEIEWERREQALRDGIPLPGTILESLRALGEQLGLDTSVLT